MADDDDDLYGVPGVSQNWYDSKQLVVTLDGDEILRRDILGCRIEAGTQQCTDPNCIGHIIPDEIVCVTALVAPPQERKI